MSKQSTSKSFASPTARALGGVTHSEMSGGEILNLRNDVKRLNDELTVRNDEVESLQSQLAEANANYLREEALAQAVVGVIDMGGDRPNLENCAESINKMWDILTSSHGAKSTLRKFE